MKDEHLAKPCTPSMSKSKIPVPAARRLTPNPGSIVSYRGGIRWIDAGAKLASYL